MNAEPASLVNSVRFANHWIGFKTMGTRSNRDDIGAKITVVVHKRRIIDEVRSGSSYESQNDIRVPFGLGSAAKSTLLWCAGPAGWSSDMTILRSIGSILLRKGPVPQSRPKAESRSRPPINAAIAWQLALRFINAEDLIIVYILEGLPEPARPLDLNRFRPGVLA